MNRYVSTWIFFASFLFELCAAQEPCYPPGGVAGIVVATIIVTLVVGGLSTAVAWKLWTRKKGHGNREQTDNQYQKQTKKTPDFAFDNPYFKDPEADDTDGLEKGKTRSSVNKNSIRSSKLSDLSTKGKKSRSGKNPFMFGAGGGKKHRALDDSCLAVEPERTVVSLRGHDFTGLGFNICGNMRDGILVKDVLHRGPASESGLIKAGDKIINVTVSFTNIVYEDALTILSYASPYDVQLEIERVPDKARAIPTTPSGSKRLGSCSFNNSGQKLFHPLYRSQSIDDLTQIDKDTFPSHGIGPRRSQSVGVAAHKLAAHFKNSDSKLEDKDRISAPLILSTTGSLNEKMLANVISDGNHHKNGLQWEKRFEDTLESEDSGSNNDAVTSGANGKKQNGKSGILKNSTSNVDDSSDTSNETTNNAQNFAQKNLKYLDSPHTKGKLEAYKSPTVKCNENSKTQIQVHHHERFSGRRAKTMAEASNALWQLDQSIKDGDLSVSDLDSSNSSPWTSSQKEGRGSNRNASPDSKRNHKTPKREEENDSDVSHDSLEFSNKRRGNRKKKSSNSLHSNELAMEENSSHDKSGVFENNMVNSVNKQHYQQKNTKKSSNHTDALKNKGQTSENSKEYSHTAERVYANNILNKCTLHTTMPNINAHNEERKAERDKDSYFDVREGKHQDNIHHDKKDRDHKQSSVFPNQRDMQEKILINRNPQKTTVLNESITSGGSKANAYGERQKLSSSENFSQNYGCSRITINGETDELKTKHLSSSAGSFQQNSQICYQTQEDNDKSETDTRLTENKNKSNMNKKFAKKSSNPAGMFTQINPFQQPSRQKNANFKLWAARDEMSPSVNGNEPHFSTNYISVCDSSGQHNRHENMSEIKPYNQRLGDVTKTVFISPYENNVNRSIGGLQNNSQALNYRQQHK